MSDNMETQHLSSPVPQLLMSAGMTQGAQFDEAALRQAEQEVAIEWRPGDLVLDLYEVRTVTEGFGEDAEEKDYHLGGFGRVYKVWHRGWRCNMAVKTPRADAFTTTRQKKMFINECETWVNLGLHPYIAACHYVRELGGVPRIFSEYADAGTLSQWIRSELLYTKSRAIALRRILDFAIQFAWGLHYAHQCGVVHQDVKPLNALMWRDGSLKVTDFGLAGARQHSFHPVSGETISVDDESVHCSVGGMTPAYCSPEQAEGQSLTQKTDLWSWAVSLLEMFQGEVTWQSGVLADAALEMFLRHNGEEERIPPMPDGVASLLRRCFRRDPDKRPENMDECVEALIRVYQDETGFAYSRKEPLAARDTPDALSNRALSFLDLGKAAAAARLFEQALEKDHHNLAANYNGGLLKWRMGKIDDMEVLASLEAVRNDHPSDWRVLRALGLVDMERGDYVSARAHLEKLLFLDADREAFAALTDAKRLEKTVRNHQRIYEDHIGPVNAVCLSPDNQSALSAASHIILLQEIPSGHRVRVFSDHNLTVTSLAFSPDGRYALSSSSDDTIKIWDTATGACARTLMGHTGSVYAATWSPDGRFILSGSEDKTLKLWEANSGRCLRTFTGHLSPVRSVSFSPNGLFALSGAGNYGDNRDDDGVKLWDVSSGTCLQTFCGHEGYVSAACFSPDGQSIISASNDKTLRLWEINSGACLRILKGHEGGVWAAAYSPDGQCVFSGDDENTIRQWEMVTGRCLRTFTGHKAPISSVCCSRDGKFVISGSWDQSVRLWAVGANVIAPNLYTMSVEVDIALKRQREHEIFVDRACVALDTGDVAAAIKYVSRARAIRGFERTPEALAICRRIGAQAQIRGYRGAWLSRVFAEHAGGVLSVVISPDGRHAASGSHDRTVKVWALDTGACIQTLEGHTREVNAIVFSSDGNYILSGGSDQAIRLWEASAGKLIRSFTGQKNPVFAVALSRDGKRALVGDEVGLVQLWDADSGKCLGALKGHKNRVTSVRFSRDGQYAISGSWDHTVRIWDIPRAQCSRVLDAHGGMVEDVRFSSDERLVLSGGWDKKIYLSEIESGRCLRVFEGHTGSVNSVAFSPDDQYIVSAAGTFVGLKKDDTIKLWETNTGRCLRSFEGHVAGVSSVCFSPDGRYFLSASEDGVLMLWEIDWEYRA